MDVYVISGLGADHRVFAHCYFGNHNVIHIPWVVPEKNETLQHYSIHMAAGINTSVPFILTGLSFGGIVCTEIAKIINPHKVILISTIKNHHQLPAYMKAMHWLPLYKAAPLAWAQKMKTSMYYFFGLTNDDEHRLIQQYLDNIDPLYLSWSIDKIIHWENDTIIPQAVHIHGSKDMIFPIHNTNADYIIEGGGHFMLMNKWKEINKILATILSQH